MILLFFLSSLTSREMWFSACCWGSVNKVVYFHHSFKMKNECDLISPHFRNFQLKVCGMKYSGNCLPFNYNSVCRLPLKSKWQQQLSIYRFIWISHDVRNLHDLKNPRTESEKRWRLNEEIYMLIWFVLTSLNYNSNQMHWQRQCKLLCIE